MLYLTHKPSGPLAAHVDFFWFFEGLLPAHSLERVLPQGTFELVIDLRAVPRKLFRDESARRWTEYKRAWLSGAHSRYIVIDVLPASSMIGVHFRPGGAAAFLPAPAEEFADQVVELECVWGAAAGELREKLLEWPRPREKFAALEGFLAERLAARNGDGIDLALRELSARPNARRLASLAEDLGMSHRRFIDQFRRRVGLAPKKFCRIQRFQRALAEIEACRKLEWTGVAADAGYYDQAHFINDFTAFSGLNPTAYLSQRGEYLNFVPVDSPSNFSNTA